MINSIEEVQALPDIDILNDHRDKLRRGIVEEMIEDYETEYESEPEDKRRSMLEIVIAF